MATNSSTRNRLTSVTAAVLEAMMLAVSSSPMGRLTNDDLLDMIVSAGLQPRLLYPHGFRRRRLPLDQRPFASRRCR